jgi:hypothetical protein
MRWLRLLFLPCLPGCVEFPPIEYIGRRVEVGTYFAEELCLGEVARLDRLVDQLDVDLDAHVPPMIDVYLYDPADGIPRLWASCERRQAAGCADPKDGRVIANLGNADHELVHVASAQLGVPWSFYFNEGVANALAEDRVFFSGSTPSSNLSLAEPDFVGAGHFVRWLWETYGPQRVRGIISRRGRHPEDAIADEIGVPFPVIEERYFAEAPGSYPRRWPCDAPRLPVLQGAVPAWGESMDIVCGDDATMGRGDSPYVRRTLRIDEPGYYLVEPSAGIEASFMRCQMSVADLAFVDPPVELRDLSRVRHEEWTHPTGTFTPSEVGRPTRLWFDAGLHEVRIAQAAAPTGAPAHLRITRALAIP